MCLLGLANLFNEVAITHVRVVCLEEDSLLILTLIEAIELEDTLSNLSSVDAF